MKTCPYCGENVANNAKRCRFFWEFLDEGRLDIVQEYEDEKITLDISKKTLDTKIQAKKEKKMTCWKRFWKYILYLLRDWFIFLVVDGITQWFWIRRYNIYADSHFAFDMFVCFIIFIIETVRLISDCSEIKNVYMVNNCTFIIW